VKVTILTVVPDGEVTIMDMPTEDALALSEEIQSGESPWLTFDLDDSVTCLVARRHIVRIDIEG
jgi:hypothetical protein